MKVKELIEILSRYDSDFEVVITDGVTRKVVGQDEYRYTVEPIKGILAKVDHCVLLRDTWPD